MSNRKSTAGDILTPERNRLCPETAEKVLFLRENLPIVGEIKPLILSIL